MGRLTMGVDVGQSNDPTALVVIETRYSESLDPKERRERVHTVRYIHKVPLGTQYPKAVERIVAVGERAALEAPITIVIDATGVGRPLVDMLRRETSLSVRAVTLTAGSQATDDGPYRFHVPKRDVVAALEVVMQTGRINVVPGLRLEEDLRDELAAFTYTLSNAGHDTYEAASGTHDDLVIALALAVWRAERPGQGAAFLEHWRRELGGELPKAMRGVRDPSQRGRA